MVKEIYVSCDIESDGPIPGEYSMLSLGAVAFDEEGKEISHFYSNLLPLEKAKQHPDTMKWWKSQPEAWEALMNNREDPKQVMIKFFNWLLELSGKPVFVGYPASFDFMFVYWYLIYFIGYSPFGFQALDIKTLAYSLLDTSFRGTTKKAMPNRWKNVGVKHTHIPTDDAREQGLLFFNIKKELRKG